MIDLKKERALIEKTALKNGFKLKQQPNGEMALNPYVFDFAEELLADKQAEINKEREQATEYFTDCEYLKEEIKNLTSKHGSAIGKLHFTEKKLGEAQQEIAELKAKLAKYESDDYVLVPREPSEETKKAISGNPVNAEMIYKAMIEAGEIE